MEAQKFTKKKEIRTKDANEAAFLRLKGKNVNCSWSKECGSYYSFSTDCEQLISDFRAKKDELEISLKELQVNMEVVNEGLKIKRGVKLMEIALQND